MKPVDLGTVRQAARQRADSFTGLRQARLSRKEPQRRKAPMRAYHAGRVLGFDLSRGDDSDGVGLALGADQPRVVAELIGVANLLARALD
jgi:hypothetical protein